MCAMARGWLSVLLSAVPISAHFLWLRESNDTSPYAVVTFGERAGIPESGAMLDLVAKKTHVFLQSSNDPAFELPIAVENVSGGNAELASSPLPVEPPFSLELAATFGVFTEGPQPPRLLKYWANADRVNVVDEWELVQTWGRADGLKILLMVADQKAPEQCKPGVEAAASTVCIHALVSYDGQALANASITTFSSEGSRVGSAVSDKNGMALLKYPVVPGSSEAFTDVYAAVNHHELVSGQYDGKKYDFVDHWATSNARLPRGPEALFLV
mmetsp:Transcript_101302/g.180033  ORF Transcript_101302/g.180033 Transcript_101302/m.180033 type:complete len:271 (-) Transcript_101302:234-1046(-)